MQKILMVMILVIFMLSSSIVFTEEISTNNLYPVNGFALEFGLSGLFNLSSYSGNNLIAAKFQLNNNSAIRLGLSGSFSVTNGIQSITNNYISSMETNNLGSLVTNTGTSITFGINADYQYFLNPFDPVKAYIGIGPMISIGYNNSVSSNIQIDDQADSTEIQSSKYWNFSWSIGARLCLGVEWFITKNISLFAEYGLSVRYNQLYGNSTNSSVSTSELFESGTGFTGNGISINPLSIQMGIAAYF